MVQGLVELCRALLNALLKLGGMAASFVIQLGAFDRDRGLVTKDLQPLRMFLVKEARRTAVHVQEADCRISRPDRDCDIRFHPCGVGFVKPAIMQRRVRDQKRSV